jgi:hypothetical protein
MSTDFIINKRGDKEVVITERSARFDLDLYGLDLFSGDPLHIPGPQQMSADEALDAAALIIYAVWCSYPDEAEAMARCLARNTPRVAMDAQERRRKNHE